MGGKELQTSKKIPSLPVHPSISHHNLTWEMAGTTSTSPKSVPTGTYFEQTASGRSGGSSGESASEYTSRIRRERKTSRRRRKQKNSRRRPKQETSRRRKQKNSRRRPKQKNSRRKRKQNTSHDRRERKQEEEWLGLLQCSVAQGRIHQYLEPIAIRLIRGLLAELWARILERWQVRRLRSFFFFLFYAKGLDFSTMFPRSLVEFLEFLVWILLVCDAFLDGYQFTVR